MAEEMDTGLEAALLYHTQLGCADESATEEEQLEKVLWYHPESDTPAERLERLSLCEGLTAFASAFAAGEAIETVQTEARARGGAECWLEYWSLQLDRFVIFLGSFEDDRVLRGHRAPTESTSSLQPAARTGTPTASTTSATSSDSNQQRQRARRLPYQPAVILVRCNCTCFNALPQALASLRMPMNTYYV